MKTILNKFSIVFSLLTLLNCSINKNDTQTSDQLTVEGKIEENKFAEIFLTNSLAVKGKIDSLTVAKSIESKAKVVLSDGETSEILTLKRDNSRFPFLFYRSNSIKGEKDKKYNLTVSIRGKEFKSETSIPNAPIINNITFLESRRDGIIIPESREVRLEVVNDLSKVCYFKIFIKNESEDKFEFASPFIVNTENITTETFPLIIVYPSFANGFKENLLFVEQTFELELVAITKDQFDFWKSIKGDQFEVIENSSFSVEAITNISNGAFGYWSGENGTTLKFKIPK